MMQVISYKLLFFCLFILFLALINSGSLHPLTALASTVDDKVSRVQEAYKNIKDIRGDFVQKSYIKDLKRTDTFKGQFFIKPPKMKWEYKGDKPHIVYITEKDIIIYQKKERQAFRAKLDSAAYGQVPMALLGGLGSIKEEFEVLRETGDGRRETGNGKQTDFETQKNNG